MIRTVIFDFHEFSNQVPETGKVTLFFAAKNFVYVQLFIFGLLLVILTSFVGFQEIRILKITFMISVKVSDTASLEPKLCLQNRISEMSSFHVGITHGDRHYEVNVEMVYHVSNESHGNDKTRILKVCHLYVHGSEFDSPADI